MGFDDQLPLLTTDAISITVKLSPVARVAPSHGCGSRCSGRELTSLTAPVTVMASEPENQVHRRATARALLGVSVDFIGLTPMPEPLMTDFEPGDFADAIVGWLALRDTPD